MATFKYFSDMNGETVELKAHRLFPMKNKEFALRFPGVKGKRSDSFSTYTSEDINGTVLPVTRVIERKARPSLHKCDDRCMEAKGFKCECSCGGKNHGAGSFSCEAA